MDRYSDGTICPVKVLRPKGSGWEKMPDPRQYTNGYPALSFLHRPTRLFVISAVEVAYEPGIEKGFEYHISISKATVPGHPQRCTSDEAKWVLEQFGLDGAEEDNHVPHGKVRNFWRPVADNLVGLECPCKQEEQAIIEDKGDYVWRP